MLSLISFIALSVTGVNAPQPPTELREFLKSKAPLRLQEVTQSGSLPTYRFESGAWQGTNWKHTLLWNKPAQAASDDTAVLYITGDGPRAGDYTALRMVTALSGMPVAMLFDVPNQPLWDLREDDLIAHTFEKYLETGDGSWPLLFPMTRGALRAMDAVQAIDPKIRKFVVTGASKRGWTTWFVGATGDQRVVGIAPMVYDNLNIPAQMPHQIASWGEYSPMIQDYTRRGLQAKLETPRGQQLARMVDPFFYRRDIRMPALIVTGTSDPYWTVDAMSLYWNDLAMPKRARVVPNAGHDLGDGLEAASAIAAFARASALGRRLPEGKMTTDRKFRSSTEKSFLEVDVRIDAPGPGLEAVKVFQATSTEQKLARFNEARFVAERRVEAKGSYRGRLSIRIPDGAPTAVFAEFRYRDNGRAYGLTTPVTVLRPPAR